MEEESVIKELDKEEFEYYALFNVDKNTSAEDIRKSYRRLCKIYHPDKFQDEHKQKMAGDFFSKVQEAYKVLSDPRLRSIYDKSGKKGLADDQALISRNPLPPELLEEYEKFKELYESRTYIQNCNPHGNFMMELDATRLINKSKMQDLVASPLVYIKHLHAVQSIGGDITKMDYGEVSGVLSYKRKESVISEEEANESPSDEKRLYNKIGVIPVDTTLRGGILCSWRHSFQRSNWLDVFTQLSDVPMVGLRFNRELFDGVDISGNYSFLPLSGHFGDRLGIRSQLSNSTTGILSESNLGSAVSLEVVHQISSTTSLQGELCLGKTESYVKGKVTYQPQEKYWLETGIKASTTGFDFMYGIKHQLANMTSVGAFISFGPTNGVGLKLKFSRASMNFVLKFHLSDDLGLPALFYATAIPLALYGCIKFVGLTPLLKKELQEEIKRRKSEKTKEMAEKKKQAEGAVELMEGTLQRILSTEQAKHGLLIVEAWYGKLFDQQSDQNFGIESKVIDVCVPLQCLVMDSKLILHDTAKADLPGFYDPCFGETKHLRVKYTFRGTLHEVTIENSEPLAIPRASHKILNSLD